MNDQITYYQQKLAYETDAGDLYIALQSSEPVVVIDTRSAEAYRREHIPGAIHLPHNQMNRETTAELDRNLTYVTYCDDPGCNAATKGAMNLALLGFAVKELMGGLECWKRRGYATEGEQAQPGRPPRCGC